MPTIEVSGDSAADESSGLTITHHRRLEPTTLAISEQHHRGVEPPTGASEHTEGGGQGRGPQQDQREEAKSSTAIFSNDELHYLWILFTVMDKDGSQAISIDELFAYAEESDDMAQGTEVQSIITALDADGDGAIAPLDFILFAARMKELYQRDCFSSVLAELTTARTATPLGLQVE